MKRNYLVLFATILFCSFFFLHFNKVEAAVKIGQGYFFACASSNCSQSVSLEFKPKAIFFYWTEQTTLGFAADASGGWGFAASTTPSTPKQAAVSVASNDADTTAENSRYRTPFHSIAILNAGASAGTLQREATTTFTTTGFDVAWRTPGATTAYIVHYYAIGGGDIEATDANGFFVQPGTGSQSYSGLSFQPDFIMFAWTFTEATSTVTAGMEIGLGIATSSSAEASILNVALDADANNVSKRWQQSATTSIIAASVAAPPVIDALVDFTQFNSNGFTVNRSDGPAAVLPVFYMAIKGGKHNIALLNRPTGTGSQATTAPQFTPKGLFMMTASSSIANSGKLNSAGGMSLGTGTTTASSSATWFQDFNVDSSDANMHATSSLIAIELERSAAIVSKASLTSLDTNGYTLNWTKVGPLAAQWYTWSIGNKDALPVLTTDAETEVGNTSVRLNGTLSDDYTVTTVGFAWGTSSTLTNADTSTTTETGTFGAELFSQFLQNLKSNTTYYYRAYGSNSTFTGYGSIEQLTTGIDNTPARKIRLFQGYKFKVQNGGRILINKE